MSYEHKENTGSIFTNDKREKETHPHYKGSAKINGVDYWVSSWVNDKNGKKYMSLSFQEKEQSGYQQSSSSNKPEIEDDLPF